jgi:MFS superfamily sulfate permease-like transporter
MSTLINRQSFRFKDHWKTDLVAGFLVFLLALPLSLGIAKASGFPAAMGVFAAIVGGLATSWFKVAPLTIKGPAAGLITICSAAVLEFGGETQGWQIAAAAITVAALIQIAFGFLKFGSLSDLFPHSAVHGMLAAIGIIIIVKQIPVLLGDEPSLYAGEGPIELILDIPEFITHAHWHIAVVGIVGLFIMFLIPQLKHPVFRKIPAPMVVLLLTVPMSIFWHFSESEPSYSLVQIGDFWGTMKINADYSWLAKFVFWKYVLMILFVNSLESLLTVKAIDNVDPHHRKSDYNADLKALGVGNFFSGLFGGLPIISEVVRSSSNVSFGATTKWSNFFHGLFLLIAMLLLIPTIEMIPNAALAAMLIYAGYRLAAPKHFIEIWKVGKEQLAIFLITIIVTLLEDLLLGIFAGIFVKMIFHLVNGATFKSLFKPRFLIQEQKDEIYIQILDATLFTHLVKYQKVFNQIPNNKNVTMDFKECKLIDHSFMEFVSNFVHEHDLEGSNVSLVGLENHVMLSDHPLATRKLKLVFINLRICHGR